MSTYPLAVEPLTFLSLVFAAFILALLANDRRERNARLFISQLGDLRAGDYRVYAEYSDGSGGYPMGGAPGSQRRFVLTVAVRGPGSFFISKPSVVDNVVEGLGLTKRIVTDGPVFGSRLHLGSEMMTFAEGFFSSMSRRQAALSLFELGCTSLSLNAAGLAVTWSPFKIDVDTPDAFVQAALPHLAVLVL